MFSSSAHQQIGDAFQQLLRDVWPNPEVHNIWHIATTTPDDLSDTQRERFGMVLYSMFAEFSNVLQVAKIDPSILEAYGPIIDRMSGYPAVRAWWKRQSPAFPPDSVIRQHVDARLLVL